MSIEHRPVPAPPHRTAPAFGAQKAAVNLPMLRASSRWKPSRSATTKAHAIMTGARFTTVYLGLIACMIPGT